MSMISAKIEKPPLIYGGYTSLRQAWVSNLNTINDNSSSIIDLHPQVFGSRPRIDVIHENIVWQRKYKYVVSLFFDIRINIFDNINLLSCIIIELR